METIPYRCLHLFPYLANTRKYFATGTIFFTRKKNNDNSVFLFSSFEYKPSGLLGYSKGPDGGQSACVAARPFLTEMGCLPVKTMTQIGTVRMDVFISL